MNTLLKIKYLLCVTRTMNPCNSKQVIDHLLPIATLHGIKIIHNEALLPENDPLMILTGIEKLPKNRIYFPDVVAVMDYAGFIWIYMRTGYIHILSKDSPVRMYNHMMLDNLTPPGRFVMFWYKLQTYIIKKLYGPEIKEMQNILRTIEGEYISPQSAKQNPYRKLSKSFKYDKL